jgi:hypothetical protein
VPTKVDFVTTLRRDEAQHGVRQAATFRNPGRTRVVHGDEHPVVGFDLVQASTNATPSVRINRRSAPVSTFARSRGPSTVPPLIGMC